MKSGLAVVAALLLISGVIAYGLYRRYKPELAQTQDIVTGLIYFMEDHAGQFPASENEFRASTFVEKTTDGFRVLPKPGTKFRTETHGIVIHDVTPFRVAWGADLTTIQIDDRGKPRWPDGKEAALVIWPSSPPSSKTYTLMLLTIAEQIRGVPLGNPAAGEMQPAPGATPVAVP